MNSLNNTLTVLRSAFSSGKTKSLSWREQQIDGLISMLLQHQDEFIDALRHDIGKPPFEAWLHEVQAVTKRLCTYRKKMRKWVAPKTVGTMLVTHPAKSTIIKEPLGVVLVISPWNYPIEMSLVPVAGAIMAGNCVLLKPSEIAGKVAALYARLIPKYLDNDCVKVVEGGAEKTAALLQNHFDHIFFTGSAHVGKIVMRAAAEHLTPVTLELGGKSPCIVDESANLDVAARRIIWGKFMNCGQVCVSPDYLLVHQNIYEVFLEKLKSTLQEFYGEDPKTSKDYGRIVNKHHFDRLMGLLNNCVDTGGTLITGGDYDANERYISPTLLTNIPKNTKILEEEIFGPLLPIIKIKNTETVIEYLNARAKPLSLYVFCQNTAVSDHIIKNTSSGGVCINAVVYQITGATLPFGGVGDSGMGHYHGCYSVDTFSNLRGIVDKKTWLDLKLVYPPATAKKQTWLRRLL